MQLQPTAASAGSSNSIIHGGWTDNVARLSPAAAKKVADGIKNNLSGLKKNLSKDNLRQKTEEMKKNVQEMKKNVMEKMKLPTFVRTVDKLSFTVGVSLMLLTEYVWLEHPGSMYRLYISLIVPLVLARFVTYHARKWHYFLLDFCYYCQLLLMAYIVVYWRNPYYFQLIFALCSGPLGFAVIPWRNSIVFHDWDRLTSVVIHIFPPIVVYTLRWYTKPESGFVVCPDAACTVHWSTALLWPLAFYLFWQLAYVIKTELMDRGKLEKDKDLITSLRWLADLKPHPIYRMARAGGYKGSAFPLLLGFQLLYTLLTLLPVRFIWSNFYLHTAYLGGLILSLLWAGASFYFDVFSERYAKQLKEEKEARRPGAYLIRWRSLLSFCAGFVVFLLLMLTLIETFNHFNGGPSYIARRTIMPMAEL